MVAQLIFGALLASFMTCVHADSCETIAAMAKDAATLRDAGVPLAAVEKRLRKDVQDPEELKLGLIVGRLVYKTNATGEKLKKEVLKKCK